jgi:hypothetical protein
MPDTTPPDTTPITQPENLHPSMIDLKSIKTEEEMKKAQETIDNWTENILKNLRQLLEAQHVKTFSFGFIQEGTKMPLVVAGGNKYDAARCAAATLRIMKEQIDKDLIA